MAYFRNLFFRKCTDSIRNEYTDICVLVPSIGFLPLVVVFAIIGISLYRLKKNESTGLIALLWVIASVIMFFVGIVLYKQYTSDGTYFETLFYTLAFYFVAVELTVPGGIIIMILTAIKKKIER